MTKFNLNTTLEQVRSALNREDVTAAIRILEDLQQPQQVRLIDQLNTQDSADLLIPRSFSRHHGGNGPPRLGRHYGGVRP